MKKNDRKKQTAFLFSQETKEGLEPVTGIPKGKGLCLPKGEKPRYTGTLLTVAAAVLLLGASTLMVHGFSAQRVAAVEMEQTEKDQLNVVPAVENVMETVAENGKVYAYYYGLEHQEEIIQKRKKLEEAEVERLKSDPAVSEKDRSILLEDVQEQLEKTESELRAAFEREASYQPVISPQEAANIAGVFIERAYGVDLTQKELQINLAESDSNMLYRPAGRGMLRLIWYVMAEESSGKVSVTCTLDATT